MKSGNTQGPELIGGRLTGVREKKMEESTKRCSCILVQEIKKGTKEFIL